MERRHPAESHAYSVKSQAFGAAYQSSVEPRIRGLAYLLSIDTAGGFMSTIVGESLFYETARVLQESHPISYYQYRALISFIEMIVLHDRVVLFAGEETDDQFVSYFLPLIELVEGNSDFQIDIVSSETRANYLRAEEIRQFETICKDV